MQVAERIRLCRLIDRIHENEKTCKRAGIMDASTYRGKSVASVKRMEEKLC